jgi:hypothetical protein
LWQRDIDTKKDREDREALSLANRNKEIAAVLKQQMQILENQKEEEKRLKAENARLMVNILLLRR